MATVNLNFVISEMEENNFLFWKIISKNETLAIQDDESLNLDSSIATLKKKLQAINANIITIEVSSRSFSSKRKGGDLKTTGTKYQVTLDNNTPAPIEGRAVVNIQGLEEINKLKKEIEELKIEAVVNKYEQQINGLQAQFEEFKNKKDENVDGVNTLITQYITSLLIPSQAQAQINGHQTNGATWLNMIERWEAADEDAGEIMEKIVTLAEKNKIIYNGAKSELLKL
jgi:hypothetical protein